MKYKELMTIKLGTGLKTSDDFYRAIRESGKDTWMWGKPLLYRPEFKASDKEIEVDLVIISAAELGFEKGADCEQTYKSAIEAGLQLCPHEVGPQLCLQYSDIPQGENLLIAMDPIAAE